MRMDGKIMAERFDCLVSDLFAGCYKVCKGVAKGCDRCDLEALARSNNICVEHWVLSRRRGSSGESVKCLGTGLGKSSTVRVFSKCGKKLVEEHGVDFFLMKRVKVGRWRFACPPLGGVVS